MTNSWLQYWKQQFSQDAETTKIRLRGFFVHEYTHATGYTRILFEELAQKNGHSFRHSVAGLSLAIRPPAELKGKVVSDEISASIFYEWLAMKLELRYYASCGFETKGVMQPIAITSLSKEAKQFWQRISGLTQAGGMDVDVSTKAIKLPHLIVERPRNFGSIRDQRENAEANTEIILDYQLWITAVDKLCAQLFPSASKPEVEFLDLLKLAQITGDPGLMIRELKRLVPDRLPGMPAQARGERVRKYIKFLLSISDSHDNFEAILLHAFVNAGETSNPHLIREHRDRIVDVFWQYQVKKRAASLAALKTRSARR